MCIFNVYILLRSRLNVISLTKRIEIIIFAFHLGLLEHFFLFLNDILECLGELRPGTRCSNAQKNKKSR